MLLSPDAIHIAREGLTESSFYKLAHQDIFRAVLQLSDAHNTVDLILLRDELSKQDALEKAGGEGYLLELMEAVPTSANAEFYVEIVREHALRRQLIETASRVQQNAYQDSQDVDALLDQAEANILAVRRQKDAEQVKELNDVLLTILARLEELHQHPGQLTGLATGFYDLDGMLGGLQPGHLIVVAARPSIGKTSFALNVLDHVCTVARQPAALYTLEMSAEQVASNFLCIHNSLDTHQFAVGALDKNDWVRLEESVDELVHVPLYIDDSASIGIMDLRARVRRVAHRQNLRLVVVDYLQLLESRTQRQNRATEVAEISRGLKGLARELGIPVIAVSQLSRRVEQEQRQPRLSDLRESGAIEQDADVVLLLHRKSGADEEALPDKSGGDWTHREGGARAPTWDGHEEVYGREAQVIVAKQRNGPTGLVRLHFRRRSLRFESPATGTTTTAAW